MKDLKIKIDERYSHIKQLLDYISILDTYKDSFLIKDEPLKTKDSKKFYMENSKTEDGRKVSLKYKIKNVNINLDLINILKSNLILMSYNLIEFIVASLLDEVYSEIKKYDYDLLKDDIKKKISKDFTKASKDNISNEELLNEVFKLNDIKKDINPFGYNMIKQAGKSNNNLSGNISYETLKEIGKSYCFTLPIQSRSSKHIHLENFKINRNKLAHGNNSFTEIGKIYTTSQLEIEIFETINYLYSLQNKVDDYILNKYFLI